MNTSSAFLGLLSAIRRSQFLAEVVINDFIPWALWEEPKRILRSYVEYARACAEILSISFLLLTLLSPWKGIAEQMPSVVRWDQFLQALFVNLVTRAIGMVIRLIAIVCSFAVQFLLLALFILVFLGWFLLPLIAAAALILLIIIV